MASLLIVCICMAAVRGLREESIANETIQPCNNSQINDKGSWRRRAFVLPQCDVEGEMHSTMSRNGRLPTTLAQSTLAHRQSQLNMQPVEAARARGATPLPRVCASQALRRSTTDERVPTPSLPSATPHRPENGCVPTRRIGWLLDMS
eukprot:Opistho-2@11656